MRTHTQPKKTKKGFARALNLFKQASRRVPAYKDFLHKLHIDPEKIETETDFSNIPPTDKSGYLSAYSLSELSWDGNLQKARYVSSSSGSTGIPFYWPRGDEQDLISGKITQRIYERIFGTGSGRTLFVNLFALGTWMAGFEFYNAASYVARSKNNIVIITPGIEKGVAITSILKLAPEFDRIVLAGYPPFIKDVLESGITQGLVWEKYDVRLITAGESFSELWRTRVLSLLNKPNTLDTLINVYGMAEVGIVGHETPVSVGLRRLAGENPELSAKLTHEGIVAALYQFDPKERYFEVGDNETLILTTRAGLPLVRYNTRDQGGMCSPKDMQRFIPKLRDTTWNGQSFVYLHGRRDLSLSFYALMLYIENMKYALETFEHESCLSGLFTMQVGYTKQLDQQLQLTVELAPKQTTDHIFTKKLTSHLPRALSKVNTEYAKLCNAIGNNAVPKIKIVPHGEIDSLPGRKHKWVKR